MDPISIMAAASTAYSAIKKAVELGQELEGITGQLSKWAGAISDLTYLEEKANNPSIWKSLSGSAEAEAVEIFSAKKQIEKQKQEIMTMIGYMYGKTGQDEYVKVLREVKKRREETVYRKEKLKETILTVLVGSVVFLAGAGGLVLFTYLLYMKDKGAL